MKRSDTTLTLIPTSGRKARYRFIEWREDGRSFFAEKKGRPYIFTLTPPLPPWEKLLPTVEAQAPYPSAAPLEIRQCSLDPAFLMTATEAEREKWRDEYRDFLNRWLEVLVCCTDFGSPKTAFPVITEQGREATIFKHIAVDGTKPLQAFSEFTRPGTPVFMAACAVVKWRVTFADKPPAFAGELEPHPVGKLLSEEYERAAAAVTRAAAPDRAPTDRPRLQAFAKLYTAISQGGRVYFRDLPREQREVFNKIGVTTPAEFTRLRDLAKKDSLIKNVYAKRTKQQQ